MKITRNSQITWVEYTLDLPVTEEQLKAYEEGALLQDAFPDLAPPLREFIKSGITPEEWKCYVLGERDEDTMAETATNPLEKGLSHDPASLCPICGGPMLDTPESPREDATGQQDDRQLIVSQLLRLFALCRERNIYLPDLYREAESIADPERG